MSSHHEVIIAMLSKEAKRNCNSLQWFGMLKKVTHSWNLDAPLLVCGV